MFWRDGVRVGFAQGWRGREDPPPHRGLAGARHPLPAQPTALPRELAAHPHRDLAQLTPSAGARRGGH
jgi:hypothetical protein